MRDRSINSYSGGNSTVFLIPKKIIIDEEDFIITVARDEEKIAAVLYCMSQNDEHGYTIRTLRKCATRFTPIGERTVKRIVRILAFELFLVRYDTRLRKWVPNPNMPRFSSYQQALEYVLTFGIRFR